MSSIVLRSRPASVTVVSPASKQACWPINKALISLDLEGVGIILSMRFMALSVSKPVNRPFCISMVPPATLVAREIPASSSALALANPACPSIRFRKTGVFGK